MNAANQVTEFLPVILPLVWGAILGLGVFLYVLLGGYDLGLGVLFPLAPTHQDRDAMMSSVSPFWDGNETWLVLGGGGLLAAFPLAYSVMLPALYIPIILMLIGLILRGVAFEFRFKASRHRWMWDWAFTLGSIVAALMQGVVMGAFVQGFTVVDNKFAGGPFDWLTPFSAVTAVALLSGYVLLSAGWLIMKSDEALRAWAYDIARYALIIVAAFILIFSLWTPFLHPEIAARWFTPANMVMLSPVPLATDSDARRHLGRAPAQMALRALPALGGDLPAVLHRARGEPVPLHHPAQDHALAGGRRARIPALHAVWRDPHPAHHLRLHRLFLLRVLGSLRARHLSLPASRYHLPARSCCISRRLSSEMRP